MGKPHSGHLDTENNHSAEYETEQTIYNQSYDTSEWLVLCGKKNPGLLLGLADKPCTRTLRRSLLSI